MSSVGHVAQRVRASLVPMLIALFSAAPGAAAVTTAEMPSDLGALHLVAPENPAKGVVLYLAPSGVWSPDSDRLAAAVAGQGYVVAGIPADAFLAPSQGEPGATCLDLVKDLTAVAGAVAARASIAGGGLPILLGESEGASLVYGAVLQAPSGTFHAALTLDFCPATALAVAPCASPGHPPMPAPGAPLVPVPRVDTAWFAFATGRAPACLADAGRDFISRIANARLVSVADRQPAGATGTGVAPAGDDWQRQLLAILQWLDPRIPEQVGSDAAAADIGGLPLVEVRAPKDGSSTLAVMLSGDGGWAALDRAVSARLAERGISTVGWDSLSYYWSARDPNQASRDLARLLRHYLAAWRKERVVLIGYSFGADVLPFLASRLPPDLAGRIDLLALLGAGPTASFEFHLSDWLGGGPKEGAPSVPGELAARTWPRVLCIYGLQETNSICPALSGPGVVVKGLPGDHHFNADYTGVADLIVDSLKAGARQSH